MFLYKNVQFLPASFLIFFFASMLSIVLLWRGFFHFALTATFASGIWTILGGLFLGNPNGNLLLAFPLVVIQFLLFTRIRITIYASIAFLLVMLAYFWVQDRNGTLVLSFAIDSVLIYVLFTITSLLTVQILNAYIEEKTNSSKKSIIELETISKYYVGWPISIATRRRIRKTCCSNFKIGSLQCQRSITSCTRRTITTG